MGKITLSGAMPGDEMNGLASYSKDLMEQPNELRLIVGVVSADKTVIQHRTGVEYPVVAIRHWEMVPEAHRQAVADALGAALADRTGKAELPFAPGEDIPPSIDPFPEEEPPE